MTSGACADGVQRYLATSGGSFIKQADFFNTLAYTFRSGFLIKDAGTAVT